MSDSSISFYTLGCRLNQSETAVIQNSFEIDGYRIVNFEEPADIVVINTCTVTENGDADTRRLVHKINRLNPKAHIALIGCQVQIQKEKLAQPSLKENARLIEMCAQDGRTNNELFDLQVKISCAGYQKAIKWIEENIEK